MGRTEGQGLAPNHVVVLDKVQPEAVLQGVPQEGGLAALFLGGEHVLFCDQVWSIFEGDTGRRLCRDCCSRCAGQAWWEV